MHLKGSLKSCPLFFQLTYPSFAFCDQLRHVHNAGRIQAVRYTSTLQNVLIALSVFWFVIFSYIPKPVVKLWSQPFNMTTPAANLKIEELQHQLSLMKAVYEEMITNEEEFGSVKPIQMKIRQLEKVIRDLTSDRAASIFSDTP